MLRLVAFSKKRHSDLAPELTAENLRKKTPNALYAVAVAQDVLNQMRTVPEFAGMEFDCLFCTGEGEILQTYDFYRNMANGERARPLVFQNSLHNSTLGALSLIIPSLSSGITISNGDVSFEMGLDLALASSSANPILIIGTDVYSEQTIEDRKKTYSEDIELVSGACAGIFIPEKNPLFKKLEGPAITNIEILSQLDSIPQSSNKKITDYYPANSLEEIYAGLKKSSSLTLDRPRNYKIQISTYES